MLYFSLTIIAIMLIALAVVIIGVAKLSSNKKKDLKLQNKLMALRVTLQTLVIMLIGIVYFFSK